MEGKGEKEGINTGRKGKERGREGKGRKKGINTGRKGEGKEKGEKEGINTVKNMRDEESKGEKDEGREISDEEGAPQSGAEALNDREVKIEEVKSIVLDTT